MRRKRRKRLARRNGFGLFRSKSVTAAADCFSPAKRFMPGKPDQKAKFKFRHCLLRKGWMFRRITRTVEKVQPFPFDLAYSLAVVNAPSLNSWFKISKSVCKKTTTIGPTKMPIGPNTETPPMTLSNANSG